MSNASQRLARGISLIEALVAMAVMAFGMLGVVGMQATLRANADLSKQRTEAMRIAQERMEDLRNFSVLPTTAGAKAFADKTTVGATAVIGYTTNTSYTVSTTVTPAGAAPHQQKDLEVVVAWTDRAGTTQDVRLMSTMAKVAPELAATLVVSAQGAGGVREPEGRRRGIPPQAKNFGDGTSGFVPPGNPGNVAWVFNNVTGLITSVCTTSVTDNALLQSTDLTSCVTTQSFQLIYGFIRLDLTAPPTAASVQDPTTVIPATIEAEVVQTAPTAGTIACFHGSLPSPTFVVFFCPVPVVTPAPANWAGTLRIREATLPTLSPNLADVAAANRKVCRFRTAATYAPPETSGPLGNQNFVIIAAGNGTTAFTCPSPPSFPHQPAT